MINEITLENPCLHCGEREKETNSDYCKKCEKELIKTKIPIRGVIFALFLFLICVFCFIFDFIYAAPALQVVKGDIAYKNKNFYSAYTEYKGTDDIIDEIDGYVNEIFASARAKAVYEYLSPKAGCNLKLKTLNSLAGYYSPIEAANAINYVFSSSDQSFIEKSKAINEYKAIKQEYSGAYEKYSEIMAEFDEGEITFDEIVEKIENLKQEDGASELFLNYFEAKAALECNIASEDLLPYFEKLDESALKRDGSFEWLYYKDYITALLANDEYEKAKALSQELVLQDKSKYYSAYLLIKACALSGDEASAANAYADYESINSLNENTYALKIYLLRLTGKLDKSRETVKEALESYPSIPEIMRQQILLKLLDGEYDEAYDLSIEAQDNAYTIYSAYGDSNVYTDELNATIYLTAALYEQNGSGKSKYDEYLSDILESYNGHVTWQKVIDILNGDLSIEQVLTTNGGDLT